MKTLILVAVIVGMNAVVRAADPQVIRGNDGSMNRQSTFPDDGHTSRFGQTNQIEHGTSTWSGSGTGGGMMHVPSSTMNTPSGVTTNVPSSTLSTPSGDLTNSASLTSEQPSDTNAPTIRTITP